MASYLHPGVYIEEIPSGAKPIEGVSTSVTAFVGAANRGPAGAATLIGKWDDYASRFGSITSERDHMGLAVQAFYLNGGGAAYICRLVGAGSAAATASVNGQGAAGGGPTAAPVLLVNATSEGEWGNGVYVQVVKPDPDALSFTLLVGHRKDGKLVVDETFANLTMVAEDDDYALTRVNGNSSIVELSLGAAADPEDAGEQYQAATLTGAQLPTAANHFTTGVTAPMTLTLNINNMGADQVTVTPAGLTADNAADGAVVAQAIQAAVRALGTASGYQTFTCAYSAGTRRFVLTSAEDDSNASLEVYGGDLAEILGLDPSQTAVLTGAAVASAATLFSSSATGIPSLAGTSLTLDIDRRGSITITLQTADLGLAGDNAADGGAVALAIQNAVRAVDLNIPSYKDFECEYTADRRFVLTSGCSSVRRSGLTVSDGPLADFLGLNAADSPVEVPGRQMEQGTARVIPVQSLGTLSQGVQLLGGVATGPTANDYANFYANVLRKVRDASILVLPGQPWPATGARPIIDQSLAHCEAMKNRILIVDPPQGFELDQAAKVNQLGLPTSTYSALYYPWVRVANPLYNVDTNPNAAKTVTIAPSAFAAGMWAKIDSRRGVWKAPAGVEAQLIGAADLEYTVEDLEQGQLNPLGVNCYRKLPSYGAVIWGSRTLATKANPEWRYVPVRRTAIFIEESIYQGIQWAVFEPNDHPLWGALRGNIGSFMNGLFRAGAFQGKTANDAYFVRCGLGDTMTQGDIDRGQVIVIVGFAPLKPAEFVIVRIQQKVGEQ
jgi:hypothetical protein